MKKLPKHIINKIEKIVKKNSEINKLICDINDWNPKLIETMTLPNNWTWWQYFFGNEYYVINKKMISTTIMEALNESSMGN